MRWRSIFTSRTPFGRQPRDEDLDRELRCHLDLETEERQAAGVPATEARYAAQRALGNTLAIKEEMRAVWGWTSVERLVQDIRYAVRLMSRSRGFTVVAVLTMALGIGANTAIFSLVDAVLLRTLPVRDPEQLVALEPYNDRAERINFSYQMFERLRIRARAYSGVLAAQDGTSRIAMVGPEGRTEEVTVQLVSGSYFQGTRRQQLARSASDAR